MQSDSSKDTRLRQHPDERFASGQMEIDLAAATTKLRSEPNAGEGGHRQETLYHHGGATIALFAFDRFTHLAEHKVAGVVGMQVLRGRLKITVDGKVHDLKAGYMLVLAPGVKHAIAAEEESEMLLTVHLD